MNKKIRITANGPYEVTGNVPLVEAAYVPYEDDKGASERWQEAKRHNTGDKPYLLCRCGHSGNKPFCDSSHYVEGFSGEELADRSTYDEAAKIYSTPAFDLMDREDLCAVARFCDLGVGAWKFAFKSDNASNAAAARKLAMACPSGRLTIRSKDGEKLEPELEQEIYVSEDVGKGYQGPLYVKGGIEIESTDGTSYETRNRVTLCRCGESKNIPFCDSSHLRCEHMKSKK